MKQYPKFKAGIRKCDVNVVVRRLLPGFGQVGMFINVKNAPDFIKAGGRVSRFSGFGVFFSLSLYCLFD